MAAVTGTAEVTSPGVPYRPPGLAGAPIPGGSAIQA